MAVCPTCRGDGRDWYQARDGEYVYGTCERCQGTGTVDQPRGER